VQVQRAFRLADVGFVMAAYDEEALWIAPKEDRGSDGMGILLADRIAHYVEVVNLIEPFDQESLRPAYYKLHVGDTCYIDDQPRKVTVDHPIVVPPNGLVYVTTREWFNIPYYMIARYSLRVEQVYRGLLIDNGLQVDPGYHRSITVPVHNLADQDRVLNHGEAFLCVEFVRTTSFQPSDLRGIRTEKDLVSRARDLRGYSGKPLVLFTRSVEKLGRPKAVPDFWLPGENHKSSTLEMAKRITQLGQEVERKTRTVDRRVTRFQAVAILSVLVFLFGFFVVVHDRYAEVLKLAADSSAAVREREKKISELDMAIQQMQERVAGIEKRLQPVPPNAPAVSAPKSGQ
jgi:deoxycytidine triphosphate deaminase